MNNPQHDNPGCGNLSARAPGCEPLMPLLVQAMFSHTHKVVPQVVSEGIGEDMLRYQIIWVHDKLYKFIELVNEEATIWDNYPLSTSAPTPSQIEQGRTLSLVVSQ